MTRPTRTRDIRKARHDKELFRWFGHGTELPDLDEPRDEADPAEFDITAPEQKSASAISPSA